MGIRLKKGATARLPNVDKTRSSDALSKSKVVSEPKAQKNKSEDHFDEKAGTSVGPKSSSTQKSNVPMALQLNQLQATLDTPMPVPEFLEKPVEDFARQLWNRFSSESTRNRLDFMLTEDHMFDPLIDAIPDEQRLGKLMGCIPLAEGKLTKEVPPLKVAALEVETGTEHKVSDPLGLLKKTLEAQSESDVVIAPEWLFVSKERFYSEKEFQALTQELTKLSEGSTRLLLPGTIAWVDKEGGYHNTALALSEGKVLHKIDKAHDGDDIDFAKKHGAHYARGKDDSTLFSWRGFKAGLEICRDHGDARLRRELNERGEETVDLQFIVSAGVNQKHTATALGGVVITANGAAETNETKSVASRRVQNQEGDLEHYARCENAEQIKQVELGEGARAAFYTV